MFARGSLTKIVNKAHRGPFALANHVPLRFKSSFPKSKSSSVVSKKDLDLIDVRLQLELAAVREKIVCSINLLESKMGKEEQKKEALFQADYQAFRLKVSHIESDLDSLKKLVEQHTRDIASHHSDLHNKLLEVDSQVLTSTRITLIGLFGLASVFIALERWLKEGGESPNEKEAHRALNRP